MSENSINRIRLEFKEKGVLHSKNLWRVLIESDWNLKQTWKDVFASRLNVLIESDWNLKFFIACDFRLRI